MKTLLILISIAFLFVWLWHKYIQYKENKRFWNQVDNMIKTKEQERKQLLIDAIKMSEPFLIEKFNNLKQKKHP